MHFRQIKVVIGIIKGISAATYYPSVTYGDSSPDKWSQKTVGATAMYPSTASGPPPFRQGRLEGAG